MVPEETHHYGELIPLSDLEQFKFPIELPEGFQYKFERFTLFCPATIKFGAEFRVNIGCEAETISWFDKFKGCNWLSMKLDPNKGKSINIRTYSFKQGFICQHGYSYAADPELRSNNHGQQRRVKCIDCKMHIQLAIRKLTLKTRRTYQLLDHFPLFVRLYYNHNHIHFSVRSLSHNNVSLQHRVSVGSNACWKKSHFEQANCLKGH
uniref:Uncharacterized protein n=1 Tax=Spongospora subterranea TaxID=70186 RepID=A0A0H5QS07_9EUKA|eukprot:CRZ04775.1 hypothetical protein [Spongospora subterranea]